MRPPQERKAVWRKARTGTCSPPDPTDRRLDGHQVGLLACAATPLHPQARGVPQQLRAELRLAVHI